MSDAVDVLWDRQKPTNEELVRTITGWGETLLQATDTSHRSLSIVLTDDVSIQALNRQWREIDAPTDVLSFPMDEGESPPPSAQRAPLGDIVISVETAARQAPTHDYTLSNELCFLLVHGVCHLLGHDHGEPEEAARMRTEESRLLALIFPDLPRPETPY